MAEKDSIIIDGVKIQVPKWAQDVTLKEINNNIKSLVKVMTAKSKLGPDGTDKEKAKWTKEQARLNKELGYTVEVEKKKNKQTKEFNDSFQKGAKGTNKALDDLAKGAKEASKNNSSASKSSGMISNAFSKMTSPVGLVTGAFTLASAAVINFADYINKTANSYLQIYDSGLTFQAGLFDLRLAASEASLPLSDFTDLLVKNSAVVAAFGTDGGRALGQLSKQTRNLVHGQMQLGVSYSDINEYLGNYLETVRLQGFLDSMTQDQRAAEGAQYIKELTLYSQVLGKSRKQIDAEAQKAARSPNVQAFLSKFDPAQAAQGMKNFLQISAGFSGTMGQAGEAMTQTFGTILTSLNPYETEFSKSLLNVGAGDLFKKLKDLGDNITTLSPDEINKRLADIVPDFNKIDKTKLSNLLNNPNYQFKEGILQIQNIIAQTGKVTEKQLRDLAAGIPVPLDPFTSSMQKLSDIFADTRSQFENIFAKFIIDNQDTLVSIAKNLVSVAQDFSVKLREFLSFVGKLFDPATRDQAIADIKNMLDTVFVPFLNKALTLIIDKILDAVTDYFSPGKVIKRTVRSIYNADEIEANEWKAIQDQQKYNQNESKNLRIKKLDKIQTGAKLLGIEPTQSFPQDKGLVNAINGQPLKTQNSTPILTEVVQPEPTPTVPVNKGYNSFAIPDKTDISSVVPAPISEITQPIAGVKINPPTKAIEERDPFQPPPEFRNLETSSITKEQAQTLIDKTTETNDWLASLANHASKTEKYSKATASATRNSNNRIG